jgi:hypothetical protein
MRTAKIPGGQTMSADKIYKASFPVGKKFSVNLTFKLKEKYFGREWDPRLPRKGELREKDWKEYQEGRNTFLAMIGEEMGGAVLVVE